MKPLLRLPLALCLALAASLALAEGQIDKLMELSGINSQLDAIPASLDAGMKQAGGGADNGQMQEVSRIMHQSFAVDKLKKRTRDHLADQLSDGDVAAVLKWLQTPLGKKITALEVNSSGTDNAEDMQAAMPKLMQDHARIALIKQLDKAVQATESAVALSLGMQRAMLVGAMANAPEGQKMSEEQIDGLIANMRPQIKSQYEQYITASMAYTYRSLTDDEVKQYINFANSGAGKRYHKAATHAMSQAVNEASEAMGRLIGQSADKT